MTAAIVRLLPADEQALLKCYIEGTSEPDDFGALYGALEVPANATPPRLAIAVAQILLHHIQGTLPQWASVGSDKVFLNRKEHKRHKDARLAFNPQLICTINWADSGPGFSWPESYHVTYLPGFDKFVITASRDGPDAWGCDDHAIGVADGSLSPVDAAKEVVTEFWCMQVNAWEQPRWAYLFSDGLIDTKTANDWADEVWCQPMEEETDEEEEQEDTDGLIEGNQKMTSSHEPKPKASATVQHGKPSNPRYPVMSLEEARKLGLTTDPVLIIFPTPRTTSKD